MFQSLGRALAHLRQLKGLSQAAVAGRAGIGKSQLSKYEGGRELPKLDSLEKVLRALEVSAHQFFYVFYLFDSAEAMLAKGSAGWPADSLLRPMLLTEATDQALFQILSDVVTLSRCVFEEQVLRAARERR